MAIDVKTTAWPYLHKSPKDPDAKLDYQLDWSEWLVDGESISGLTVTVDNGLTLVQSSFDATTTTAWVSGGTVSTDPKTPTKANVTFSITTNSSPVARIDDRTLILTIKDR